MFIVTGGSSYPNKKIIQIFHITNRLLNMVFHMVFNS